MKKRVEEILGFEVKVGDKIKLLKMVDDPDPIPVGSVGVVTGVVQFGGEIQIQVEWIDVDRRLNLICPPDLFVKI